MLLTSTPFSQLTAKYQRYRVILSLTTKWQPCRFFSISSSSALFSLSLDMLLI
jgi:hypothetical protein